MHVVHAVCVCGHTGSTSDERAVKSHMEGKSFNGRCSACGRLNQFKTLLGWAEPVSPTAGGAQINLTSEPPSADKSGK